MSPRIHQSARERESHRARWADFVRGRWKQLAYPHVLDKRETSVLSLRLGLTGAAQTHAVIARRFGISPNTVARWEQSARRKVAAALTREGQHP